MCHFVTAVLPANADVTALDALARSFHRQFQPMPNSSIEAQLRSDERYFLTTLGHCDCGTHLGADAYHRVQDHQAEIKEFRAKGWSESKITRWLDQKQQASTRQRVRSERGTTGVEQWLLFLNAVLESTKTRYIGILLHWYGSLSGRIQLAGRQKVSLAEVTAAWLAAMQEDVLYEFWN